MKKIMLTSVFAVEIEDGVDEGSLCMDFYSGYDVISFSTVDGTPVHARVLHHETVDADVDRSEDP